MAQSRHIISLFIWIGFEGFCLPCSCHLRVEMFAGKTLEYLCTSKPRDDADVDYLVTSKFKLR